MYKRDVGILILSICAVYISLRSDGPITFRKSWYLPFDHQQEYEGPLTLPEPVSADLNGDGKPEFLVVTPKGRIALAAPRKHGDGFAPAFILTEVTIDSLFGIKENDPHVKVVAMGIGSLLKARKDLVRKPRKQVVAIVTSDGHVATLDSNLNLKWKVKIPAILKNGLYEDVAVVVTSHTMSEGQQGMVVVSAREVGKNRDDVDVDDLDKKIEREEKEKRHAKGRATSKDLEEVDMDPRTKSRHVSYYAFSGNSGNLLWKHQPEDFHKDLSSISESGLSTAYSERAISQLQEGAHYGERSCRDYRESLLQTLPHRWFDKEDNALYLAHFQKHKKHQGAQRQRLASTSGHKEQGKRPPGIHHQWGLQERQKAVQEHHKSPPNVVVAHVEDGIEIIHMYSGRPVCRLALQPQVLHADINGDGIPDHVHVKGGLPNPGGVELDVARHQAGHEKMSACMTSVTSGIPPRMHLFNGTICSALWQRNGKTSIDIAPPVALPVPRKHGHYTKNSLHQHMNVAFFNSRGEVTSYDHRGTKLWSAESGMWWKTSHPFVDLDMDDYDYDEDKEGYECIPTFSSFRLRRHATPSIILAAGCARMSLVTEHGRELWAGELPERPIQSLISADFNLDGYMDIILVSRTGLYGWAQVRSPGGMSISALVGGLIVVLLAVLLSQNHLTSDSGSGLRKGRSTDRVD